MTKTGTRPSNWIGRNPIISFIILVFLISYLIGIPFNMFVSGFLLKTDEITSSLLPRLITVYGPGLSAILVMFCISGQKGPKTLMRKLIPHTKHFIWWISIPVICTAITLFSFVLGGVPIIQMVELLKNNVHILFLHLSGQFIIVGIGEELGWRGWLLPRLTQERSVGVSVLVIIIVWGLWHFPILFSGYDVVVPWVIMLVSMAFMTTWLWYKVEGNIFVLAVAHASVNAPEIFIENRLNHLYADHELILAGWEVLGYAYFLLALIIVISNPRLWRKKLVDG